MTGNAPTHDASWTLLSFRDDHAIVVDAFSHWAPVSADLFVPAAADFPQSGCSLRVRYPDGGTAIQLLAPISADAAASLRIISSLVVVEEDAGRPGCRRFNYVATLRRDGVRA